MCARRNDLATWCVCRRRSRVSCFPMLASNHRSSRWSARAACTTSFDTTSFGASAVKPSMRASDSIASQQNRRAALGDSRHAADYTRRGSCLGSHPRPRALWPARCVGAFVRSSSSSLRLHFATVIRPDLAPSGTEATSLRPVIPEESNIAMYCFFLSSTSTSVVAVPTNVAWKTLATREQNDRQIYGSLSGAIKGAKPGGNAAGASAVASSSFASLTRRRPPTDGAPGVEWRGIARTCVLGMLDPAFDDADAVSLATKVLPRVRCFVCSFRLLLSDDFISFDLVFQKGLVSFSSRHLQRQLRAGRTALWLLPRALLEAASLCHLCRPQRRCALVVGVIVVSSTFFLIARSLFLFALSYGLSHRHHDESRRYFVTFSNSKSQSSSFQASRRRAVR